MRLIVSILFTVLFLAWCAVRTVAYIQYNRGCEGHLKRAADANTIALALEETKTAVDYMEFNQLTTGYTSVLYTTPDEDIGFWYRNIKSAMEELKTIKPDATQLEKTNVLMKLRETLLDEGKSTSITAPDGISIYPRNAFWAFWLFVSEIGMCLGWIWCIVRLDL
jgi:hypothetical protein